MGRHVESPASLQIAGCEVVEKAPRADQTTLALRQEARDGEAGGELGAARSVREEVGIAEHVPHAAHFPAWPLEPSAR